MTTKAKPNAHPELGDLPEKITAAITAMKADLGRADRTALDHAHTLGTYFAAVKAKMAHGKWEPWVIEHTGFKRSTVKNYRDIAAGWETVRTDAKFGDSTSIRAALEILGKIQTKSPKKPLSDDRITHVIGRPEFKAHKLTPAVVHRLLLALGYEKPAEPVAEDAKPELAVEPAKTAPKPTRRGKGAGHALAT